MAIDQHSDMSNAGDVSHQHWVEEILDQVCSEIPSEKVILTIAGGGFDWPENSVGKPIGYPQAISTAKENKKISFTTRNRLTCIIITWGLIALTIQFTLLMPLPISTLSVWPMIGPPAVLLYGV
jgi:spore germination protein YaaH